MFPAIEFLEVGSIMFWILAGGGPLFLLFLLESEYFGGLWFFTAVFGGLAAFCLRGADVLGWIAANPFQTAAWVAGYFAFGVAYGFAKWFSFVRTTLDKYIEYRKWKIENKRTDYDLTDAEIIRGFMVDHFHYKNLPPEPSQHVDRILNWIGYWPISLLWTLINDPIRRIASWLYKTLFAGFYAKISAYVFRDRPEFQVKDK